MSLMAAITAITAAAHLPLYVLQMLLLLDWREIRDVQALADAFAGKLCSIALQYYDPDRAKPSLTQLLA
jgi:hypothetical protein